MDFLKQNWTLILTLLYVLSPIDFIPEAFIPAVGTVDDGFVVFLELVRRWYEWRKEDEERRSDVQEGEVVSEKK